MPTMPDRPSRVTVASPASVATGQESPADAPRVTDTDPAAYAPAVDLAAAIIVSVVVVNAWAGMTYGIDTASFLAWRGESEHARPVT
jgi:hypothetical protein